jgi:hypothetical protein
LLKGLILEGLKETTSAYPSYQLVHKISDISVGRAGYSMSDFVDDVKCNCTRESVPFDNDIFNELVG